MEKRYIILCFLFLHGITHAQNIQWTKTFMYGETNDQIRDLVVDASQNVYLSGNYMKSNYPNPIIQSSFICKVDPGGNVLWRDTLAEYGSSTNILVLSGSGIYTVCQRLIKWDTNGDTLWRRNIAGEGITYLNNALYIAHVTTLRKYDTDGNLQWNVSVPAPYGPLRITNTQNYLYVQSGDGNNYNPCRLHKFDTLGNRLWTYPTGTGYPWNMTTDSSGNSYLVGDGMVEKIDSSGTTAWTINSDSLAWYNAQAFNDTLYVCGSTGGNWTDLGNSQSRKSSVSLYSVQTGAFISKYLIDVFPGIVEEAKFIFKSGNDLYLAGDGDYQMATLYLAKISLNNSTPTSLQEINGNSFLLVYPNPTQETLQVSYRSPERTKMELHIYSAKGETIFAESIPDFQGEYKRAVDLGTRSKGAYFIEIINGKKRQVKKIVLD